MDRRDCCCTFCNAPNSFARVSLHSNAAPPNLTTNGNVLIVLPFLSLTEVIRFH
ncbi:hypothetical protein JCM19236_5917 [Vibrio sp. JCM 19236]|nr:hypothetical protein JCM19236_5917 [Vibrio sp. JCM 19236]